MSQFLTARGSWEPFIGLGISSNIRVFAREREEAEGKRVQYSAGTLVNVGVTHFFTAVHPIQTAQTMHISQRAS